MGLPERLPESLLQYFPNLIDGEYGVTSEDSEDYNCFAWAAGDTSRKWAPVARPPYYWPLGAAMDLSLEGCIAAYGTLGYAPCAASDLEHGYEKIAIYIHAIDKTVTHAARQLPDGFWTSKLGDFHDIKHKTPRSLESPDYGVVAQILSRGRQETSQHI